MKTTLLLVVAIISAASAYSHLHRFPCGERNPRTYKCNRTNPNVQKPTRAWEKRNTTREVFEDVYRNMKVIDDDLKDSCSKLSNGKTREIVRTGRYKILSPVTGFSETDFNIEIKGRVLFVNAVKGSKQYSEVRTLPTFVDTAQATYTYDGDELGIVFPINDEASTCNLGFSDTVKNVPPFNFEFDLN